MIVGKYIKQLLDERKQVVLPGFGNLEVKESGGGVPASGRMIDPPGTWVRFDSGFSKDDGLLASVYGAGEELSGEEAGQRVLELVDSIKFALDKGEPYAIPETGSFTRDDDGKVHFKVDPGWVIEPDQYGLESMDLLELEDIPADEEKAPEKPVEKSTNGVPESKAKPLTTQGSTTQGSTTPVSSTSGTRSSKPKPRLAASQPQKKSTRHIMRWRVIWIVAGVLIVILIALIFIPVDSIRNRKPTDPVVNGTEGMEAQSQEGSSATNEGSATTTTGQQNAEGQPAEGAETETATATEEIQPVAAEKNYFIVAGSFKHLKNASDLQDQLKAKGYQAEVMVTENRMYRVSVASFATKNEAERSLAEVKAVPGLKSCWLLSN